MSSPPKFEFWKNAAGEWSWHLKGSNGEIQAAGEGYKTKQGALRGIDACRRNAARAVVKPRA
jgi:uncharacterized protein YegP (UPF0339 family)